MSERINLHLYAMVEFKKVFLDNTNKKEIYLLSLSEMNFALRTISCKTYGVIIYSFLKIVFFDLQQKGVKALRFSEIKTPYEIWGAKTVKNKNDIYTFQMYSKVFDFCTNLKLHTQKSLEEICINGTCKYVSCWIYVMLHLNNAWRNGDVKEFPVINISDILEKYNIFNLLWFESNEITVPMSRAIVQSVIDVMDNDLIMSKTQMKGYFYCSDELAPSLSTALILLTLYNNEQEVVQNDYLIRFDTKSNEINESILSMFFKDMSVSEFIFKSRKFNKSVVTFIYYLANLSGDSKALLYSMKLRGHVCPETTLGHYIQFDLKTIEELSRKLFARGEFGYVASLLIKRLHGNELSFDDITNEIINLNETFGDVIKVNTTVGFMNLLRAEQSEVSNAISQMTYEQIEELCIDLFTSKLPSKDTTKIQCLYSRNCKRPDLNEDNKYNCCICPYRIPTIYAISEICDSIMRDILKISQTKILTEKFKLALAIDKKKINILDAMNKYGKDYVYACMGCSREEFIQSLAKVPKLDEIIEPKLLNNKNIIDK